MSTPVLVRPGRAEKWRRPIEMVEELVVGRQHSHTDTVDCDCCPARPCGCAMARRPTLGRAAEIGNARGRRECSVEVASPRWDVCRAGGLGAAAGLRDDDAMRAAATCQSAIPLRPATGIVSPPGPAGRPRRTSSLHAALSALGRANYQRPALGLMSPAALS